MITFTYLRLIGSTECAGMLPPHWFEYLKACITGFEGLEVVSSGGFRYISPTGWLIELKWNKLWICVHKKYHSRHMELRLHFLKTFFFLLRKKNKNILHFCSLQIGHRKTNKNPNFQILLKMFFLLLYELKKKNPMYILKKEGLVYGVMKERDHDQTVDRMWGEG